MGFSQKNPQELEKELKQSLSEEDKLGDISEIDQKEVSLLGQLLEFGL